MQREGNVQKLNWADKTMSVLRERQLEACESRLSECPEFGLFAGCNDVLVEKLWSISYDAQEHPLLQRLHTTRELQAQIMAQLPAEAALLSVQEHLLLERLLILDGEAELLDWEESGAAESLVKRLWCRLTREDEDRLVLHLPKELMTPLQLVVSSKAHGELREKLFRFDATIRGLLYIGGLLHYEEPLAHLMSDVVKDSYADNTTLALRFLRTSYDYTYDDRGDMILLHPGLAEPERVLRHFVGKAEMTFRLDESTLVGAINGVFPEEIPLFRQMQGLLRGAVRPEISEEEAVEDLRMLAKQGVGIPEMNEVLASLLTVMPTPDMLEGVRQLSAQTPRWCGMCAAMVQ